MIKLVEKSKITVTDYQSLGTDLKTYVTIYSYMAGKTLTEELMKEKRLDVLQYLINNRDKRFSINEVAENVDTSYKTVQVFIDTLEEFGFIESEKHGRTRIISVNQDSPFLEVFERLGEIDSQPFIETAEEFTEEITERYSEEIESVILFGSVARGLPVSGSDIDILILVKDKEMEEEINDEAWSLRDKYSDKEGLPINIITQTVEEFKRNLRNDQPLESRIKDEGEALKGELPDGQ
ncbi:MAG: nucleotidyltransferase domain-containing protein [Candidatus Nanohaloarchaea archaeon]